MSQKEKNLISEMAVELSMLKVFLSDDTNVVLFKTASGGKLNHAEAEILREYISSKLKKEGE